MYNGKNGIYPEGQYEVGVDIEVGTYVLKGYEGYNGSFSIYKSYKDYLNDNIMTFKAFQEEYHLPLRENGIFIEVENATMTKV